MGGVAALTMREARTRAALITVDTYQLDFDLTGGAEHFTSTTTIRFRAAEPGADSFVELRPSRLHSARLNGTALEPASLVDGRLPLPGLRADNELVVVADFPYSRASEGMHRFVDPADDEIYLYAQPSITQAPRMMACFDQPDLKAPVMLRVSADPRWQVVANAEGKQISPGRWEFEPTPPLATYLMTLAAGPYQVVRSSHDGIPLGVFARASLGRHLQREAAEIFEVTAAGLDHFHELFGIRYAFGKYDQVFAPEFSWGAMEFPGCVLIRDELMFRAAVTDSQRMSRAVLLLHEMAHMWFGDLVTMRWWDDLWLNESFADYLGWRVTAEATRWSSAWSSYSVGRKANGMAADQRPTTHPVAATEVGDTATALANFDGISYAKGSAVLRQLVAWVGDEAFRSGLRDYFQRHRFGNATLADLLAALSQSSGRDLADWAGRWLRQPQADTLRPEVVVGADGRYQSVHIIQTAHPSYPVLRAHRIGVGVYDRDPAEPVVQRRTYVQLDLDPDRDGGRTEVSALSGVDAGALLLVNDGDLSFAKVRLAGSDEQVAAQLALLPQLTDPLARAVLWGAAWDACRDGELPPRQLVAAAVSALPAETEQAMFETMLNLVVDPVISCYLPYRARPAAYAAVAAACSRVLAQTEPGGAWQLAAARGLVSCAGPEDVPWLRQWLAGEVPTGLLLDADLRWLLLGRLAALGAAGEELIAAEQERDRTARGRQEATRARAALPDPAAKQRAWELITTEQGLSNRLVVAAADGFWQPDQAELTAPYVPRYFEEIDAEAGRRTEQLMVAVTTAAYPRFAVEPGTLAAAQARLSRGDLHPAVRRQ